MRLPDPLPVAVAELISARMRLLGQAVRMGLVVHLAQGPATVEALTNAIGAKQQNVSQHLGLLYDAGVVDRRHDGRFVVYELVDRSAYELYGQALQSLRSGRAGPDVEPE